MKISILVPGRLHGFEMALYFQKIGVLNELVTGYPKKYVTPFGIEKQFVKSLYINEIINRTTNWLGLGYPLDFLACEAFDYLASKLINFDSNVYFIWSSYGLKTIRTIKKKNPTAKIIIVRGSAHIEEHEQLLKQVNESQKFQINPKIIDKELKEYAEADYVTIPSTFAYNTFLQRGFESKKLFLNTLGVDLKEFPFRAKKINKSVITLGNVGTLSKQKNVATIIKVVTKLNLKNYRFNLILAGPIEHSTFDKELLNASFINYVGKKPQNLLFQIYQDIDLFIINSVQEGMAMVQLQAMSCGCPIIATTNSGGLDLVKNYTNGIIIPILDEKALENAILWFYENKDKIPEMGKQSRNISERDFTWDDFGKRNLDFINQITKN